MKITKQKNNLKSKASYLNRLKLNIKTIKKVPYVYANNRVVMNLVSVYRRGQLIEKYLQKI